MEVLVKGFEEFNLGREPRFKGEIKNSTLFLIHSLPAAELKKSIKFLKSHSEFKKITTLEASDLDQLKKHNPLQILLYSFHLHLDDEIASHQRISSWALENDYFQLNPYNKIAKIFDDKYLFYTLMVANDIPQPFTMTKLKSDNAITEGDYQNFKNYPKIVVKPRFGTERIDLEIIDKDYFYLEHSAVTKINSYDDCIIQEFIDCDLEIKVLHFMGQFFCSHQIKDSSPLKAFVHELVDVIDNYAIKSEIIMPQVFSMDILIRGQEFFILEINIRPGAFYRFQYKL